MIHVTCTKLNVSMVCENVRQFILAAGLVLNHTLI